LAETGIEFKIFCYISQEILRKIMLFFDVAFKAVKNFRSKFLLDLFCNGVMGNNVEGTLQNVKCEVEIFFMDLGF